MFIDRMNAIERTTAALIVSVLLAGCAPWTPEQKAAWEQQERRYAMECERRGGWYVSGSCISRGGGQ